jgi:hypothetical protein
MPNPLLRLGTPNQSKQPPQRLEPIPEHYAGNNHPYRGTEDHGIPDNDKPEDSPGYDGNRDAYFELEPTHVDVVPVRIVAGNESQSRIKFRTHVMQLTVGDQPRILLNRNDKRTKAYIKSISAGTGDLLILGGTAEEATLIQGYPIAISNTLAEFPTATQGTVYGIVAPGAGGSAAGTVINVFIAEEISVAY